MLFAFHCVHNTVFPAPLLAPAKQKLKHMEGLSAFIAKRSEAAFTIAGDDGVFRELRNSALSHNCAFFRVNGTHHVEIAAADGALTGVFGLGKLCACEGDKLPCSLLLNRILTHWAGVVDSTGGIALRHIGCGGVIRKHLPYGNHLNTAQCPQFNRAVGAGGVYALHTLLIY